MTALRRAHPGLFELGVFALAYATYFGVRALTEGKVSSAIANAIDLVHVERNLDLDWEDAVQGVVLGEHALVDAVNAMYIWGHWPLLIVGGFLLFHLGQAEYRRLRTVILLSGALGLVVFAVFPVAPPRLAPVGLQDTVTLHSQTYRTVLPPSLINEYAAMPSFHAGWNLLLGIELFRVSRNVLLRVFAVLMPVAMAFSVVATANHFVLDVVGGALVVVTALALVSWFQGRKRRTSRVNVHVHSVRRSPPRRQRPGHAATRRGPRATARRG
jgi:membrane-associated phospholipid phosphatase